MTNTNFGLIDIYAGLPEGKFRDLMEQLPRKIQRHFTVIVPSHHLDSVLPMRRMPIVQLWSEEGMLPIPPEYGLIISKMELLLQVVYAYSY